MCLHSGLQLYAAPRAFALQTSAHGRSTGACASDTGTTATINAFARWTQLQEGVPIMTALVEEKKITRTPAAFATEDLTALVFAVDMLSPGFQGRLQSCLMLM